MAQKKVNVRKDYSYAAKKSLPKYKPASIARKPQFLILRGPGFDPRKITEENIQLREFADRKLIKLKFLQANTADEMVKVLKDGNTWATGIILVPGGLIDESGILQKTMSKLMCATTQVTEDETCQIALANLLKRQG